MRAHAPSRNGQIRTGDPLAPSQVRCQLRHIPLTIQAGDVPAWFTGHPEWLGFCYFPEFTGATLAVGMAGFEPAASTSRT